MGKQHNDLNHGEWNKRLDDNLESEQGGNPQADENAEAFSAQYGSNAHQKPGAKTADNMKQNQPKPGTPKPGDIAREE